MICIKTQHFDLNRILLLGVGLWPYQRSIFAQLQRFLFFGILASCVIFQFTTFLTAECTQYLVIKVLSFASFFIVFLAKYNLFLTNMQNIKYLLEVLEHICDELKDENEIAIIRKYGNNARLLTIAVILLNSCGIVTYIWFLAWPLILDIILPTNESGSRVPLYIMTEYFIDQKKYFYLIQLHKSVAFCVGSTTVTAVGTMIMGYLKHMCGIFRIASYRIEHAMDILQNISLRNEIMIYKEIVHAADLHCRTIKIIKIFVSNYEGSTLFLMSISVASLSFNLFQLALFGDDIMEFFLHLLNVFAIILFIFAANYVGQEITDHNTHIFLTVYNVRWYMAPLRIQRLMLFLLQMGSKAFSLNIGGVFVGSLETFATLASASISYFTVLYSTL